MAIAVTAGIARDRRDRLVAKIFRYSISRFETPNIEDNMSLEKHQQLRDRTKKFALRIIRMSDVIPDSRAANVINNQILRAATGMAANYRAAGRSRSKAEFIAKVGVALEEADETLFWLENACR